MKLKKFYLWMKYLVEGLLLIFFGIVAFYSLIFFVGDSLIDSLPYFEIGTEPLYYLFPLIGIVIPLLLHIRKNNLVLTLLTTIFILISIGFWVFLPMNMIANAPRSQWDTIVRLLKIGWMVLLGLATGFEIIYLVKVIKGKIMTLKKPLYIIYLASILLITIKPFLLSIILVVKNGLIVYSDVHAFAYGSAGATTFLYWLAIFVQFEIVMWTSFGYSAFILYHWSKKIHTPPISKKNLHFVLFWLFGGLFGVERVVSGNKYQITLYQSISSIVLIFFVSKLSLLRFAEIQDHKFLYFVFLWGIPISKIGIWIYSLVEHLIVQRKMLSEKPE